MEKIERSYTDRHKWMISREDNEMEEEKDVKKIVIHYEDGTEKVIDKGFFCNMKEEDGSAVLEFTMCHVSGREIELIVEGCLQLGFKLGMFDSKKEED